MTGRMEKGANRKTSGNQKLLLSQDSSSMRRLLLAWRANAHEASQQRERLTLQGFGERVSNICVRVDIADREGFGCDDLAQEVPFDVDLFNPGMERGVR